MMMLVPLAVAAIGIAAQLASDRPWGAEPTVALLVAALAGADLFRSVRARRRGRPRPGLPPKEEDHDDRRP